MIETHCPKEVVGKVVHHHLPNGRVILVTATAYFPFDVFEAINSLTYEDIKSLTEQTTCNPQISPPSQS